jgi:hypothetical protein
MRSRAAFLWFLVLCGPAWADMYPDASNAKLPDARVNIGAAPHVASTAALVGASTAVYPAGVWRGDFSVGFGAPPLWYLPSGSACSLNSGNGDGGFQVKSADGKCWLATFSAGGADVRQWGAVGDGLTDNQPALQAAINWAHSVCGIITLPSGRFIVKGQLSLVGVGGYAPGCETIRGSGRPGQFDPAGTTGTNIDFTGMPPATNGIVGGVSPGELQMINIENLQIVNATGDCINVQGVYLKIEDVTVGYCGGRGIDLHAVTYLSTLRNVLSSHNIGDGIDAGDGASTPVGTTLIMENVYAIANGGYGVWVNWFTTVAIIASAADQNTAQGFYIQNTASTTFIGADAEQNSVSGYLFDNATVSMIGSRGSNNDTSGSTTEANFVKAVGPNTKVSIENSADFDSPTPPAKPTPSTYSVLALTGAVVNSRQTTYADLYHADAASQVNYGHVDLVGVSGSIGGSAIAAGNCATGTVHVQGATGGLPVDVTPQTYPGDALRWEAFVTSPNTVTVRVCTDLAAGATPVASVYNVYVRQAE